MNLKQYLIIDGYNIINSWPELNELKDFSLEIARIKLIEIMTDYQAVTSYKVVVVYDAHHVTGGVGSKQIINGVEVVYTKEGESADSYIERLVKTLVLQDAVVKVATSDWTQQRVVMGQGALRISARELLYEVEKVLKDLERYKSSPGGHRPSTVESRLKDDIRKALEKWRSQRE